MNRTSQTEELESLGAKLIYQNPDDYHFPEADLIVHTRALPKELTDSLNKLNNQDKIIDSGTYYNEIVDAYASGEFKDDPIITEAIKKSEIAPLYDIDFGNCLLIGVTGSKGKTTTAYMIYETLYNLGAEVSGVTTIGAKVRGKDIETGLHTSTPSAQELARLFKAMLEQDSKIIVLEASSHAIATGRVAGLKFDIGIITNLQPEHLDFHKTIEHVISTKKKIVNELLKPGGKTIINIDDENILRHVLPDLDKFASKIYTISKRARGISQSTEFIINETRERESAVDFSISSETTGIHKVQFTVPFAGEFNVYNILPSIIISNILGYKETEISEAVRNLGIVSGRNEVIQETPFKVVLDFAHTPESLEAILSAYKAQTPRGKVIVVFGAAGQRDSLKRPRMGVAAAKYADITILTAEDPRTENISEINAQIKEGWDNYVSTNSLEGKREIYLVDDISIKEECRTKAIEMALKLAKPGDVVICAGKGPEKSMCIGFEERPWDEKSIIIGLLSLLK